MGNAKLGVVVPTLNSSATLQWTLCALRSQRDLTIEIVVADSGSKDGTLELCKDLGVRTIYVPPGNMYRAINSALREMDTEWITYLNSDDLVYPQSYARLTNLGEQQQASAVYGDGDYIDYEGRFLYPEKSPPPSRLPGMFRCGRLGFKQPAAIFRRSAYQELGGFDERFRLIADYDFFYRLTFSKHKLAKLARPSVAAFRVHTSQLSTREATNMKEEMRKFQEHMNVEVSSRDLFDVFFWRLQNAPVYLARLTKRQRTERTPQDSYKEMRNFLAVWPADR
jgi:glycosyltransferase involved in cell wall biosynthesis